MQGEGEKEAAEVWSGNYAPSATSARGEEGIYSLMMSLLMVKGTVSCVLVSIQVS